MDSKQYTYRVMWSADYGDLKLHTALCNSAEAHAENLKV